MTHLIKSFVIALCLPILTFAGNKPDNEKLTAISNEMFNAGNANYIIVDALRDGLVCADTAYNYKYENGNISFNGKPLEGKQKTEYEDKMHRFLVIINSPVRMSKTETCSNLRLKDVMNPESHFRTVIKEKLINEERYKINEMVEQVVKSLYEDGLIKDPMNMKLKWNGRTVRVDGKRLKGLDAIRYNAKLAAIPNLRSHNKGNYSFTRTTLIDI